MSPALRSIFLHLPTAPHLKLRSKSWAVLLGIICTLVLQACLFKPAYAQQPQQSQAAQEFAQKIRDLVEKKDWAELLKINNALVQRNSKNWGA